MNEKELLLERVGILSTAVGIARLRLQEGRAADALKTLDAAVAETHDLTRAHLLEQGYDEKLVDSFLGDPPVPWT